VAVEDVPGEAQVIIGAVRDGDSRGLDSTSVSNVFKAQVGLASQATNAKSVSWREPCFQRDNPRRYSAHPWRSLLSSYLR